MNNGNFDNTFGFGSFGGGFGDPQSTTTTQPTGTPEPQNSPEEPKQADKNQYKKYAPRVKEIKKFQIITYCISLVLALVLIFAPIFTKGVTVEKEVKERNPYYKKYTGVIVYNRDVYGDLTKSLDEEYIYVTRKVTEPKSMSAIGGLIEGASNFVEDPLYTPMFLFSLLTLIFSITLATVSILRVFKCYKEIQDIDKTTFLYYNHIRKTTKVEKDAKRGFWGSIVSSIYLWLLSMVVFDTDLINTELAGRNSAIFFIFIIAVIVVHVAVRVIRKGKEKALAKEVSLEDYEG